MKKIIVCNRASLDGFFSGPKGETDWFYWNTEMEKHQHNFFKEIDTMLFGRHTYDIMSDYWPTPQLLINPIILGQGKSMFQSIQKTTPMDFIASKTFSNGLILLKYAKQNTNKYKL